MFSMAVTALAKSLIVVMASLHPAAAPPGPGVPEAAWVVYCPLSPATVAAPTRLSLLGSVYAMSDSLIRKFGAQ
jgi:hypothetical protein